MFVQSESSSAKDPAFQAVVRQVVRRLSASKDVQNVQSPLDTGNENLVWKDGRSALVQFELKGDAEDATGAVSLILETVASIERANPGYVVEEFGEASSAKALNNTVEKDFERAERAALPITLGILVW